MSVVYRITKNALLQKERLKKINIKKYLNASQLLTAAIFFFISLSRWFYLPSSFTICCLIAYSSSNRKLSPALMGTLAGCIFCWVWHVTIPAWTVIGFFAVPMMKSIQWKKENHTTYVLIFVLVIGIILDTWIYESTTQDKILYALLVAASAAIMPALRKATALLDQEKMKNARHDDYLCMLLPIMMMLSGMGKTYIWILNFGFTAAAFFMLLNTSVIAGPQAMSLGFLCGLPFLFSGHGAYWCIALALSGGICGMLEGRKKVMIVLIHMGIVSLVGYMMAGTMLWSAAASSFIGCILFMQFPKRMLRKYASLLQSTSLCPKAEPVFLRKKINKLSDTLKRLSNAVPEIFIDRISIEDAAEEMAGRLCADCDHMMICWHDRFENTKQQFVDLAREAMENGCVQSYMENCVRYEKIKSILEEIKSADEEKCKRMHQAMYEQAMLKTHFDAFSDELRRIMFDCANTTEEESYAMSEISDSLKFMKYPADVVYVKRHQGHYIAGLQCKPFSIVPQMDDTLEKALSRLLNTKMKIIENNQGEITLEEAAPLKVVCGVASACALSPEREKMSPYSPENGDAVMMCSIKDGKQLIALSDGMGHGAGASRESQKTLELLSVCLEAGYTRTQAMTAVNGMMLSATDGERFATVDLCIIDLWSGETNLSKLGACMTLVIQGQTIHAIEGTALPIGIIENIIPMEHQLTLGMGDKLIMMSDGVQDVLGSDEEISNLLCRHMQESPQRMADSLLKETLQMIGGLPRDDMTVICVHIFDNKSTEN